MTGGSGGDLRVKVGIDDSAPVEMAYTDTGNTDAPYTLLLLHGIFAHKGTWEYVGRYLDEEFQARFSKGRRGVRRSTGRGRG